MCALRIEFMKLDEAVRCDAERKHAVLEEGIQQIVAQNITNLSIGRRLEFQCVVWVNGPPEAMKTLQTSLDERGLVYEEH